jgi:hypothetical protein
MEPTGTRDYKGQSIRYYETGTIPKLQTEDFLAVIPQAANKLQPGELVLIEADLAGAIAHSFDEDFAYWINTNFPTPLISGE